MPFDENWVPAGLALQAPDSLPIDPQPAPFNTQFDAYMRRGNVIGSATEALMRPPKSPFDPNYDTWSKIVDTPYQSRAHLFVHDSSDEDVRHTKAAIDKEDRDAMITSNGGFTGFLAGAAAGALDPTLLVPAFGQIGAVARGGRALEGALRLGAGAAAGTALQEAGLHATQLTRTPMESAINIGQGALFGALLGGAAGALTRPTLAAMARGAEHVGNVFDRELRSHLPRTGGYGFRELGAAGGEFIPAAHREAFAAEQAKLPEGYQIAAPDETTSSYRLYSPDFKVVRRSPFPGGLGEDAVEHAVRSRLSPLEALPSGAYRATADVDGEQVHVTGPTRDATAAAAERIRIAGEEAPRVDTLTEATAERFGPDNVHPQSLASRIDDLLQRRETRTPEENAQLQELYRLRDAAERAASQEAREAAVYGPPTEAPTGPRRYTTELDDAVPGQHVAKDPATGKVVGKGETPERAVADAQARGGQPYPDEAAPPPTVVRDEATGTFRTEVTINGQRFEFEGASEAAVAAAAQRAQRTAPAGGAGLGGSGGAASALPTDLSEEDLVRMFGAEKAANLMRSPTLTNSMSPLIETRQIGQELHETLRLQKNVGGKLASPRAIETLIRLYKAPLAEAEGFIRDKFAEYRLGRARKFGDITGLALRDLARQTPEGMLSFDEFSEAVGRAARREDKSEFSIPQIDEVAKFYREKIFEPWKQAAIDAGLFSSDISTKTALSYLPRLYNVPKIIARPGDFTARITSWLTEEQSKKEAIRTEVDYILGQLKTLTSREARLAARGSASRAASQAKIADLRGRLEQHIANWEGNTTKAAQAALKRRADAEAVRYGASMSPDQARLRGADKEVMRAAQNILKADTRLDQLDLQDIADQIMTRIKGMPGGRLPYDSMEMPASRRFVPGREDLGPRRGSLAGRTFMIPDELIEDYLHSDIRRIGRVYLNTMVPDVLLTQRFGRADMEHQMSIINAGYARLRKQLDDNPGLFDRMMGRDAPKTREAREKWLDAWQRRDLRNMQGVRDRLRGTYQLPEDPNALLNRAWLIVRDLNYLRLLGSMTLSAFPDAGHVVMHHGMTRTMQDGLLPLMRNWQQTRLARSEAKLANVGTDLALDTRVMALADMLDDYGRWTKYERGATWATEKFGLVSLMAPWNAAIKQITAVIGMKRTLEAVDKWVHGKKIHPDELTRLGWLGIDRDMAGTIDTLFKAHGDKKSDIWWANTEAWTQSARNNDELKRIKDAVEGFRAGIAKEVDNIIVTPGQEKPLWASKGIGRVISQFHSFGMSASQKVMLSGLQRRDMAMLNGMVLMIGLGMLSYYTRTLMNPKGPKAPDITTGKGMAEILREGIDRSGLLGWFFDVHNMIEQSTGGALGLKRLYGGPLRSRYANRGVLESFLGPTAGLVEDVGKNFAAAARGEWTEADTSRMLRWAPTRTLIGGRLLWDKAEHGINQALGVRERARP